MMSEFRRLNIDQIQSEILVLGSYHPINKPIVDNLVKFLKERGFLNTFLASEVIPEPSEEILKEKDRNAYIYTEMVKLMDNSDFNIFILFPEKNDSVVTELTSLIHSNNFEEKSDKIIVYIPYDYNYTISMGIMSENRLNIYVYNDESEIYQHCLTFIYRNIILRKD